MVAWDRTGDEIAGFRIEAEIGRGGMGTVYLAHQSVPRRRVALKVLRSDLSADRVFRERFERESEAAASTEHPNIVPIYATGEADGVLFMAMRYVDGSDLGGLLARDGPLPAYRAGSVITQVASALDAAHARGLVHRDVKPSNVLIDGAGNAYLCDFGLIKRSEVETGYTRTGQFMGSIEYCAPEQIKGEEVDARTDVYSLGCVLHECLTGFPPFRRDTEIATLYAHLQEKPPRPSSVARGVPAAIDDVVAKAMAKRAEDRYPTAGELAAAARRALGMPSGERPIPRMPARRRALVAGLGGVALLVAALGVFAATRGTHPQAAARHPGVPINSVARIDPQTGRVAQTVAGLSVANTGGRQIGLAAGAGGVWVGSPPNVEHVDPVTGTLRATIFVQSYFVEPVVGFRTVWVAGLPTDQLSRIDPATDTSLRPVRLSSSTAAVPAHITMAVGDRDVWVGYGGSVLQVDPLRGKVVRRIQTGATNGIAAGEDAVWTIDDLTGRITKIDAARGSVDGSAVMPGSLDAVVVGGGSVWVLDAHAGTVSVIDPETLSVTDTVRVGSDEEGIAFGNGAVWLADGTEDSVTRIDSVTHETSFFPVGNPVLRVAVDPDSGSIWGLVARPA